jgi:hypothetical protein
MLAERNDRKHVHPMDAGALKLLPSAPRPRSLAGQPGLVDAPEIAGRRGSENWKTLDTIQTWVGLGWQTGH